MTATMGALASTPPAAFWARVRCGAVRAASLGGDATTVVMSGQPSTSLIALSGSCHGYDVARRHREPGVIIERAICAEVCASHFLQPRSIWSGRANAVRLGGCGPGLTVPFGIGLALRLRRDWRSRSLVIAEPEQVVAGADGYELVVPVGAVRWPAETDDADGKGVGHVPDPQRAVVGGGHDAGAVGRERAAVHPAGVALQGGGQGGVANCSTK